MRIFKSILMLALLSLAVISCEKDEESALMYSDTSFETTYIRLYTSIEDYSEEKVYSTKEELQAANLYSIIEFREGGKVYVNDEEAGTWTESGTKITITDEDGTEAVEIVDDKITIEESLEADGMIVSAKMVFTKM